MAKICIDPGHGGKDPGATGNGLQEKDIALTISLEVARILRASGQTVVITRDKDKYIGLTPERTPKADISVSIHCNAGGGHGLETWVSLFRRFNESRKLGQAIQQNVLKRIPFKDRGLKAKKNSDGTNDYLYMIRKPSGVAVLVECGFIDSAADVKILKMPQSLVRIAEGIAAGILEYLGIERDEVVEPTKVFYKGKALEGFIREGKTYVEVRELCEALKKKVTWDSKKKTVEVKD